MRVQRLERTAPRFLREFIVSARPFLPAARLRVLDAALVLACAAQPLTEWPMFFGFVVFALLAIGAFFWTRQSFALRALLSVGVTAGLETLAVWQGRLDGKELIEIAWLCGLLAVIFVLAWHRSTNLHRLEELTEQMDADLQNLQALQTLGQDLLGLEDLHQVLKLVLDRTLALGRFDLGHIRMFNPAWNEYEVMVQQGWEPGSAHTNTPIGRTRFRSAAQVLQTGTTEIVERLQETERFETFRRAGAKSVIVVPVRAHEQIIGTLHLGSKTGRKFSQSEVRLLEAIGNQMGLAVQKAQLHEATREANAELRALFAAMTDLVLVLDREGRYLKVAPTNPRLMVRPANELIGKTIHEILDESGAQAIQVRIDEALAARETVTVEYPLVVDGQELWFEGTASPISDDAVMWVARDITERKHAEDALRDSNHRLEETLQELRTTQEQVIQQERLRALGQMASGIAHDFNNALSPIIGFSELLLAVPDQMRDSRKVRSYVEQIHTAGRDAAGVVGRLRDFYRQRDANDAFRAVDLPDLINQAISLTQFRWRDQSLAEGVRITVNTDLEATPLVAAVPADVREILTNLILNSVDSIPEEGTITIRTVFDAQDDDVLLEVADTGKGMSEEVRQRCLEPFFTTKGRRGTGLGLGMVYGIVQRHGGTLHIDSAPGQGTRVQIRLPIWRHQAVKAAPKRTPTKVEPLRVLLVEDDASVREVTRLYLLSDGHTVEEAVNGREGLRRFDPETFDLVITDRAMPELSGDEMAAMIKKRAPEIPIIMLTGFGDLMNGRHDRPAGVDEVLRKPATLHGLRAAVSRAIAGHGGAARPRAVALTRSSS